MLWDFSVSVLVIMLVVVIIIRTGGYGKAITIRGKIMITTELRKLLPFGTNYR